MGKKKHIIKFIDKKQAMSFHLIAKADHQHGEDEAEEKAELDRELKEQKAEQRAARRKAQGLGEEEEAKGEDAEEEDDDAEDQDAGDDEDEKPDDRINLLNLAAAAEGIETRAERQAKKASKKASGGQKFYLQPNFRPGSTAQIPKDFPKELLYMGGPDEKEEEYWEKQDQKKAELEEQADAPSLLPHNYDYEQHLRSVPLGHGVYMKAKRGDEMYDAEEDPREKEVKEAEEKPENPELLAQVEEYQKHLLESGRRVRATKDFVKALESENVEEGEFEELQDDFVVQAMNGGAAEEEDDGEERKGGEEEAEEYEDEEEEYEDEEGEAEYDEDGDEIPRTLTQSNKMKSLYSSNTTSSKRRAEVEEYNEDDEEEGEDDEDEDDGEPKGELDAAFDKLLEEYDDEEIGELDHYLDDNPEELDGTLELEEVDGVMNDFLEQKNKTKLEGGSIIDKVDTDLQSLTMEKLAIVSKGEKTSEEIDSEITAMLEREHKETWDAESILSTYSNTENHPRTVREGRRRSSKTPSEAGGSTRSSIPAFQPALPIPAAILRQAKKDAGEDENENNDDLEEEDEDDLESESGRVNKGKARQVDETPEDKKKRKQAVKEAQRQAKERKKALKNLYIQETTAAIAKEAKLKKTNPSNMKKL